MSAQVRRAGRVVLADGTGIVWSVADGRRGRRWRAHVTRGGTLTEALLLELDVDGRPSRLELTTAAGLLTLHPEPTGRLHGNVVARSGVRPLSLPWGPDHELAIEGNLIAAAVTVRRLARTTPMGVASDVPVVVVGADLEVDEAVRVYRRVTDVDWRIEGDGGVWRVSIDDRGMPIWPASSGETGGAGEPAEWPLELDPPA